MPPLRPAQMEHLRNWPDLGTRFVAGEQAARRALHEAQAPLGAGSPQTDADAEDVRPDATDEESVEEDKLKRDLDWAGRRCCTRRAREYDYVLCRVAGVVTGGWSWYIAHTM